MKSLDIKAKLYKKLILKNNVVVGAVLVGDIKSSGVLLRLIRERIDISSLKDRILQENFGYPDIMDLVSEREKIYLGTAQGAV
jgi:NAD(P)H-nitrite reductase large subunit